MPKAKQPVKTPLTFKDFLDKFEPKVLQAAVSGLNDSIAWELLKAYLQLRQREFEIAALDLVKHGGKVQEAASASGYAQACEDVANQFIQDLVNKVNGVNGFVEGTVREDN